MTPTEQTAKTPSPRTGLFATLRVFLHPAGTPAPKFSRRAGLPLALLLTLSALALSAAPAFAGTGHGFEASFGSAGPGAGQFEGPAGVAVNNATGDVYVVDRGNERIDEFESNGTFLRAWGWGVADGISNELQTCTLTCFAGIAGSGAGQFDSPGAIAVDNSASALDPSKEDVYVTNTADNVVEKFSATGVFKGQIVKGLGGAAFGGLLGVAVDPTGVVWVYAEETGKPVGSFGHAQIESFSDAEPNQFDESKSHESQAGGDAWPAFAVDSAGDFYVGHRDNHVVAKLNSGGEVIVEEVGGAAAFAVAVDPSSNDVFINSGTVVEVFSPAVALLETFGSRHAVSGTGIAVSSVTGAVYVADSASNVVDIFALGETPEAPLTKGGSEETATGATLHGELNPKGAAGALEYQFDYNKGASCTGGQSTPVKEVAEAKNAAVEAKVEGLQPNAEYTYCLVAFNAFGATQGNEVPFKTLAVPPLIESESAPAPRSSEATLKAQINPNNQETTYSFEYATNVALTGATTVKGAEPLAAGFGGVEAKVETGAVLTAETLYYYRVLATNAKSEETKGKVEHFTTGPPEKPEPLKPEPIGTTTVTLKGVLNPKQEGDPGTYIFVYQESPTACSGGKEEITPPIPALGGKQELATANVEGLLPNATYTYCLLAIDEAEEFSAVSAPETFTTLPVKPTLAAEEATNLTKETATLNAQVDPNGSQVTTCQLEYGTEAGVYPEKLACAPAPGSGRVAVPVSVEISRLSANTTYHWRIVATNEAGTTTSPDHTFIYPTTGEGLPDSRSYEMVTPPQKNGGLIGDIFAGPPPAISETGSRVIAMDIQCFASSESCNAFRNNASNGEPFEFARTPTGTTSEWETTALAPSAARFSENTPWLVNANEGAALFSMPTGPAQEDEWYARQPSGSEPFLPIGPATPPGTTTTEPFKSYAKLSTADLSHLVWQNEPEGGRGFWPFDKTTVGTSAYEYFGAHNPEPFLVGISNEGPPKKNIESELISTCGTGVGDGTERNTWNALSADGRTVFFTAGGHDNGSCPPSAKAPPVFELYARVDGELPDAHTVAISQPKALNPAAPDAACTTEECKKDINEQKNWRDPLFVGASTDGSKAFFLDAQQLTDKATQGTGNPLGLGCAASATDCNLYLYDFAQPEGRRLIDISTPETSGESPRAQGVLASSGDGSHVYFVAQGALTAARNGQGQIARAGADNLYVYERDARYPEGRTAFIAILPGSRQLERESWLNGNVRDANVTPDGRFLVFESNGALTPDDVRTDGVNQIFRYDAASGALVRISIGNDGFNDNGNAGTGDASIVRTVDSELGIGPSRGDPTMSNDGSYVFFQSPLALTPHALNDVRIGESSYAQNVYEWHEGHVYLVSDGRDVSSAETSCSRRTESGLSSGVCLLGSDATGANVFFTTADRLVPSDTDTQVDIYDARICEPAAGNPCIAPAPAQLPPCGGEACHGIPPASPSLLAPGTASFNGEGNVVPSPPKKVTKKTVKCKRGFVKNKKGKCVKKKSKRKTKKSTHRKGSK